MSSVNRPPRSSSGVQSYKTVDRPGVDELARHFGTIGVPRVAFGDMDDLDAQCASQFRPSLAGGRRCRIPASIGRDVQKRLLDEVRHQARIGSMRHHRGRIFRARTRQHALPDAAEAEHDNPAVEGRALVHWPISYDSEQGQVTHSDGCRCNKYDSASVVLACVDQIRKCRSYYHGSVTAQTKQYAMAYEYPTDRSLLRLTKRRRHWAVQFNGRQSGRWPSPDAAARAVARHESGLMEWDQGRYDAPDDILKWRPVGDSL